MILNHLLGSLRPVQPLLSLNRNFDIFPCQLMQIDYHSLHLGNANQSQNPSQLSSK